MSRFIKLTEKVSEREVLVLSDAIYYVRGLDDGGSMVYLARSNSNSNNVVHETPAAILALINGEEQCNSTDEVWILARDLAKECRSTYSVIAYNGGEVVANKMERLVTKLEEALVKNMPANKARAAVEGKSC